MAGRNQKAVRSEFPEWGRERCIINNSRLMEVSGIQKGLKQRIQRQIKYCGEGALYWLIANTVEVAFPSVHFLFKYCTPTPPRRHFSRELSRVSHVERMLPRSLSPLCLPRREMKSRRGEGVGGGKEELGWLRAWTLEPA